MEEQDMDFSKRSPIEVIRDINAVPDDETKARVLVLEAELDKTLNEPDYYENKRKIIELRNKINKLILKQRTAMKL